MSEGKKCELCKEQPTTILCSECHKCYCDECSEFIHKKASFKDHKVETIVEGIIVSATCPLHENNSLELFCVDEVKLCCALCKEEKFHEGHKLVYITEIQEDNEIFSTQKVRELFEDFREQANDLDKMIESITEELENRVNYVKERVKKTFEEEHKKLEEEENKVICELEKEKNKSEATLEKYLKNLRKISEYSDALSEFDTKTKGKCSILMELNIVSEMEKQRKELELLCGEEMYELHFMWDVKERKVSCVKKLFSGVLVPSNVTFPNILCREVEITWECDVSKVCEEEIDKISYVVQMKKNGRNEKWKEVYSGKEMKCAVKDLEVSTGYSVRVRCVVNSLMGKWSEKRVVKTKEIYPPKNVVLKSLAWDSIEVSWEDVDDISCYRVEMKKEEDKDFVEIYEGKETKLAKRGLSPDTEYSFEVCSVMGNDVSEWSDVVKGKTLEESFETSAWKECPDDVDKKKKYSVDVNNPRIATKINDYCYCTIIGNTPFSANKVTSWNIKILKSEKNDGFGISIGIAPSDINQNEYNFNKCGWYFDCYESKLHSGPPHNYNRKEYGPRKKDGGYVHTGDIIGVVVDTVKSNLSFALNGVNYGVAYEGVPLDKPLVPCVILWYEFDSVEFYPFEMKENVDIPVIIPIPSNVTTESDTWDSITFMWDAVEGAEFYQIEVDGSKLLNTATANSFMKIGFLPETEHSFRVRTMKMNSVSEWSDVVKGKTQKESFETSGWKECPDVIDKKRKYSVNENNPRIAIKINDYGYCTVIGNTSLPLNKVTSWNIKILKSEENDGNSIFIGVAPFDIDKNDDHYEYGWYFNCYSSTLRSGPPHNYWHKEYGLRKGEYAQEGDNVGVVMDTIKGDLSFVLKGVNYGVAYEGISLNKPLVPCVILGNKGDSVEFDPSEVTENVDSTSILIPSNIATKNITWDSITLMWDGVEGAEFYQIEVDGSKLCNIIKTNSFTKGGLLSEIEHSFRVRTVKNNSVSEWSDAVKGRTIEKTFETCFWKDCPICVDWKKKYSVDENNPRIATKINDYCYCTIIGNISLPLNKVTSWGIKILKSKWNDGGDIYAGVAPFDINQNEDNYNNCGWYFNCYESSLWSGPPHDYRKKEYGPRKKDGKYVHTGDSVGVIMDTTKGELSFVINGVNLRVAYEGIPLDKPLVPCVILYYKGDSVKLVASEMKEDLDTDKSCIIS